MIKPYTWWARKAHYSLLKVIATALLRIINSWLFTWKFIVFCKPNGNLAPLSVFVVFDVQKIPLKSLSVKWSRHREQARINDLYLYDQCSLVSFFAQTTPHEKKGWRKLHVTAVKMVVVLTETTKRDFTLHCGHSAKTKSLSTLSWPVSCMLTTVLEWLTGFLTGTIMESRKAPRSKAVATPLPRP